MADMTDEKGPKLTEALAQELVRRVREIPQFRTWRVQAHYLSEAQAFALAERLAHDPVIRGEDTIAAATERLKTIAGEQVGWTVYASRFPEGHVFSAAEREEKEPAVIAWSSWPWPEELVPAEASSDAQEVRDRGIFDQPPAE